MKKLFKQALCFWAVLTACTVSAAELSRPDCESLKPWATSLVPNETYNPYPDVEISTLFRDETILPLFGRSIKTWSREDVGKVQRWLNDCRRQALSAKDKVSGEAYYRALKATKLGSRSLRPVWNARKQAEQKVEVLTRQQPFPELPQILTLAEQALQGVDVSAQVANMHPRHQGLARQASNLSQFSQYLSPAEIEALTDKLRIKRDGAVSEAAATKKKHAALLNEIAAVPATQAGLIQLNRIAGRTDIGNMKREDVDAYNEAIQGKRRSIQQQLAAKKEEADRARATLPAPVEERLKTELQGTGVSDASIRGLRPGIAFSRAMKIAESQWRYKATIAAEADTKQFTPIRRDLNRFTQQERRDGGLLNFRTISGAVGELSFIEHYTGPMNLKSLSSMLIDRFGNPDIHKQVSNAMTMQWQQGDRYLRVIAGARIADAARNYMNYRSSVAITLWSQSFTDYLKAAKERCAKLRDKPMNELSTNDRQALLTSCLTP
jgi:hypothetical protein